MPLLQTRGAGSAKGFGFSAQASGPDPCDGTIAIFALGMGMPGYVATSCRNKYTYATCASSSATSSSFVTALAVAAGNSTRGIFVRGNGFGNTNKYTYATNTSVVATTFCYGFTGGTAAGNSTRGIFVYGVCAQGLRRKYTYATDALSSAACSSPPSGFLLSSVGNSTRGIFTVETNATTRNKYTYSTDTSVAATAACRASYQGYAAGNGTRGIFNLGCASTGGAGSYYRNKYIYATDTSVGQACLPATALPTFGGSAAGNSTRGIFALGLENAGPSAIRNKYTYATDTEALDAFLRLAKLEGIIPALESAHAVAGAIQRAPTMSKDALIIVNLSGRGDKDVMQAAHKLGIRLPD
jgi:hypothetical protein